jgi:hypothetical protein
MTADDAVQARLSALRPRPEPPEPTPAKLAHMVTDWTHWAEHALADLPHMWAEWEGIPRRHYLREPVRRALHDLETAARDIQSAHKREAPDAPSAA